MMNVLLFIVSFHSSCIYPSKRDGELSGVDSISCFTPSGTILEQILSDIDFENNKLAFVMSSNPDGIFYVLPDGKFRQTHNIDNGPDYFQEGLVRTIQNGKYGFMDSSLNIQIAASWDFAYPFNGSYANVCNKCYSVKDPGSEYSTIIGGRWFLIDKSGKITKDNKRKKKISLSQISR